MSTLHDPSPPVARELAAEAKGVAELIVRRLADRELVAEAVAKTGQTAQYSFGWGGASLSAGYAGSALVFQYASRVQPEAAAHWRALSHEHLVEAVQSTHEIPLVEAGMAAGTAGLALVFADCVVDEPRYSATLWNVNSKLGIQVIEAPHWGREDGVKDRDYDVVASASGILAYLASVPDPDPLVRRAVDVLVNDLLWLCGPRRGGEPQPWFIPPKHYPMVEYLETYPHGYVNLGLAHGISGPLAALSFAVLAGHRQDGLLDAVRHVAAYLLEVSFQEEWGRNWPNGIPLIESGGERRTELPPARTSWCYGAPGVACALLNAASALGDDVLRAAAVDAFEGALRRFHAHGHFVSATLCHGAAGLLAMCVKFARETGSDLARRSVADLTEHLLSHCRPDLLLVQDMEQPGVLLDSPGLLTGSAGVALALWSAVTPSSHGWERALLIS